MEEMSKSLRRQANIQGGVLLVYHVIMNAAVFVVMLAAAILAIFTTVLAKGFDMFASDSPLENTDAMMEMLPQIMENASGWGYLLAVAIGMLILLLWKKPRYIRQTLFKKGNAMTLKSFAALFTLVMGCQLLAQVFFLLIDWIGSLLGFSLTELLESVSVDTTILPMFLYAVIAAPVTEELLFRGLLLRSVEPFNKKLAIFASALLFGLYHGNPVQTPYAFLVGLILGYVALEFNMVWAIVLHLLNNLLYGDTLPRLVSGLPPQVSNWIQWAVMLVFFLASIIILACNFPKISDYCRGERVEPWQRKAFFRSPTIIIVICVCVLNMLIFLFAGILVT